MESLYQYEIIKLEDKDLQLRYILGGLYPRGGQNCDIFWGCDIRCSTKPVPDDSGGNKNIKLKCFLEIIKVFVNFLKKIIKR